MQRKKRIGALLEHLCKGLYEREEATKLALLSAVAGESIFLLGPPGVGKSLIARRLKFAFREAKSFEYLMTRFSTPEEVFGPVSIQKLKEEDKYERKTEKYMPGANIVFLDEIWKASSAIQNALLTIINEKVYRNGEQEVKVDLKSLITASNELPPEGENFGPLYDRLLVRYHLEGISSGQKFLQMITSTEAVYEDQIAPDLKISGAEVEEWSNAIDQIRVEDEVLSVIQIVREKISAYNEKQEDPLRKIQVYDRRWKKIVRLLRTAAFLNGREKVDLLDCFLMTHCLWNQPQQIAAVQEMVSETIRKHGYSVSIGLNPLKKEVADFRADVDEEIKVKHTVTEEVLRPIDDEYYALRKNGEQFAGKYILVKDYNKLKVDNLEVVNLYDEDFKLVNRLSAEKADREFSLRLKHNSEMHRLELQTYQKEKATFIHKKPHPLVEKFWDERYEKLEAYLDEKIAYVQKEKPAELLQGQGHLFIDEKLIPVVEENHRRVSDTLADLKLSLEKIRHRYKNPLA